jgi:uncharacterized protein
LEALVSDATAALSALFVHPIKSCAGIALHEAELVETGLDLDRAWMVVDPGGLQLTQRDLPRMALIQPSFKGGELLLRAPGMLGLHLKLDTVEEATRVQVWDDIVKAYDMGALAAQWFSDFLGRPARLARFDPEEQRLSSPKWAGDIQAPNQFSDGYPLLVTSSASLVELNRRLQAAGHSAVTMQRFRPNLVLDGIEAFDEDHVREIDINTGEGLVTLRLVKPCTRCTVPDVDPVTAATGHAVADTLAGFRADARVGGGITFGMNGVLVQGAGCLLRVGQSAALRWAFD